ncbi:MAG: sugar ABC transporter permease [Clostridia bacterium]|nr:sugar ABC transporter permease [Clostridia bacterium]
MTVSALIIAAVFVVVFALFAFYDVVTSRRRKVKYRIWTAMTAYLMLLPAIVLAFLFVLLPILYSLGYAFTDYYLLKPNNISYIGFENFKQVFQEIAGRGTLYHALINTTEFVVGVVPLQIGLALALALFVNKTYKSAKVFKVCFFAPVVISLSVTSFLWLQILSPSEKGLLNSLLGVLGVKPRDWLRDPATAMPCIIVLSAWQGCGYQMLIVLSGLSNIQQNLYEAASLDGAGAWHKFTAVTWPGLRSTFVYIIITVFIGACRILTQPMLMTGYQDHTVTLSYYMYQQGYTYRWVGYSSAVALLMTIVIGTITLIQRRVFREKD